MAMQVILTQDLPKLGQAGDVVRVKNGYGRNYLLPQGLALLATTSRVKQLEHQRGIVAEKQRKLMSSFEEVARQMAGLELEFQVQAGEEGKLFGSVTTGDIAEQAKERGFDLDRRKIDLGEPIKELGEYDVVVKLHREVTASVRVKVVATE